jgi:C-terminal processing protease CtpA/Prc
MLIGDRDMDYTVTFEHGPIGLDLETDWYGRQACVKGFKKMINGSDGPAALDGRIQKGDVLVSINGVSCLDMSFKETMAKLREVGNGEHTLHFKALELVAGDLSTYAKDRGQF